jgi:DNA-binding transcriptional LysR family regulator
LRILDLTKLATLSAVVEHGSFSSAATALALTQPAVSRQVSVLEHQLGVQLVLRTRQGVVATEAGRLLLEHGEAMLGRAALAERQIAELAGLSRGEVRLGSFFTALVYLSAEVGARLDTRHPDVTLTDELVDRTTAFRRLASGHLDVAVVFEPAHEPQAAPEEIELVPLFDDPLRVLLPSDHRLSRRRVISFADLAAETWIRPHDGSAARLLDHVLAEHALKPRLIHAGRGDEPVEAQAVVAAGRGVMLSYDLNVIISPPHIVARPLREWPFGRHVQAAVLRAQHGTGARAVLEIIREIGRERSRGR